LTAKRGRRAGVLTKATNLRSLVFMPLCLYPFNPARQVLFQQKAALNKSLLWAITN